MGAVLALCCVVNLSAGSEGIDLRKFEIGKVFENDKAFLTSQRLTLTRVEVALQASGDIEAFELLWILSENAKCSHLVLIQLSPFSQPFTSSSDIHAAQVEDELSTSCGYTISVIARVQDRCPRRMW